MKKDNLGKDMIYSWVGNANPLEDDYYRRKYHVAMTETVQSGVKVYLEIDNRKCTEYSDTGEFCFQTANAAAEYLAAKASKHTLSKSFPIYQINGSTDSDDDVTQPTNSKYVVLGILLVICISGVIFIVVQTQRKRAAGITWFPDGFLRTNSGTRRRRRGPEGQELKTMKKNTTMPGMDLDSHNGHVSQYSDDDSYPSYPLPAKRGRVEAGYASDNTCITEYEEAELKAWTSTHLEAADIRASTMLTPPRGPETNHDINARGPSGMTPIMVAAKRGSGLDTGEVDEDDGSGALIQDLVARGADLHATMDKTGETSLHLAARYARADASKRLLDAGADANAQDNSGRTPLHAAVAADALGVFQILLRNRATNLNARMHEGTTPLILAARLAIEGMVQDLISAEADINAADNSGKTALHWAAAVNNVEAVNILLAHGANRDAQDDKDETPLFLAAREGKFKFIVFPSLLQNIPKIEPLIH